MARGKKSGSGGVIGAIVIGALVMLAAVPKEVWIGVGVLAVVGVAVYLYGQSKKSQASTTTEDEPVRRVAAATEMPAPRAPSRSSSASPRRFVEDDAPVSVAPAAVAASGFRVPAAPKGFGAASWTPTGQSVEVAGTTIPGGMVYVGTSLKTPNGINDPCLIDPSKSVAAHGDYTERQTNYWPSYADISPNARRAYLNWLAGGRKDPTADIGFVFLFFCGLERRAIVDAASDTAVRADWPTIAEELRRLMGIYGRTSASFNSYASGLLDWVSVAGHPDKLYELPVPSFSRSYELPLYLRLALGQAAVDKAPVPSHLARAWLKLDPNLFLRTPAIRCEEQFDKLFDQKYAETFGAGLVLPENRTKLKLVYRPASAGLRGYSELALEFGKTPDVSVLTAPTRKLREMADAVTTQLDSYSRFVGKNPDARSALEGLLQLPATLWPDSAQKALQALKARMGTGMVVMSFQELMASLDAKSTLTKDKTLALARALESINIGIEPDVLGGAKMPKPEEKVVLFAVPSDEVTSSSTASYQAAALTLQLASAVATADGEFSVKEMSHLREQVQSWTHLTPNHIRRLFAHLRLLMTAPVSLAALKKKLEPLDVAAKETIAAFMATVAQSDGEVAPTEVKMLEKVYKALGVESKKVFADVHAVATGAKTAAALSARVEETGFKLDPARIAALQQDTAAVSALLANIFKEEEVVPPAPDFEVEAEAAEPPQGIMGLDETHTALARMMLSRPEWSRQELLDVAADLELMLDGALEHINEASFDKHDLPFFDGEDPVTINAEILEKVEA